MGRGGQLVTPEQVRNARRNATRFDWASARRDVAVERAKRWVGLDDDTLWTMVTGQTIGRSTNASIEKGCPQCGQGIYRHGGRFEVDVLADPWKIRCPSCNGRFPTNDFEAYYRSGIAEDGLFDPDRADRSLLYNTDHPDPDDPKHGFAVDDGTGWADEEGESFKLVGVYGHYGIWSEISSACSALREAFLLTGDRIYAHKAGVLLARIADVYPDMDWSFWARHGFFNSDGLSGRGRIYGRIWEPGLLKAFTECFDLARTSWNDEDELFRFLREKQLRHGLVEQGAADALSRHIERNILKEGIDAILSGDIHHNEPGDQATMAMLAIALDDDRTDDLLDWIFREGFLIGRRPTGGHVPLLFAREIDRDGVGSEGAPGYSLGWLRWPLGMRSLEMILRSRPSYTRYQIRDFPRYRQMYLAFMRVTALNRFVPSIGDSGSTGSPGLGGNDLEQSLYGFELFGDNELAQAVDHLTGGDLSRVHGAITDPDPEALRVRVAETVRRCGPLRLASDVMTGYGLAMLRDGEGEYERTMWLYYGRNGGHGHADRLNLGLYGFGLDLLPDLGYPEHARVWPKRSGWTNHTVSHNTVMVDRSPQKRTYSGKVGFAGFAENVQAVSVSSPDVYPQCRAYGRCSVLVRVSERDFYVVDLYRVSGGCSHHFLFHAAEGDVTTQGMVLQPQARGTYAGEDVGFGEFYDGTVVDLNGYRGSGFQYLYDVRRCPSPERVVSADWRVRDTWKVKAGSCADGKPPMTDVHLRWSMFSPPGEMALCHGDPPQNKPGNPRRLTYAVASHEGKDMLDSSFLSLIEAYDGVRVVNSAEELEVPGAARALKVHLPGNRVDTLIFGHEGTLVEVDGRIRFDGSLGVYSEVNGLPQWAVLTGGTLLGTHDRSIRKPSGVWRGRVEAFEPGRIWTFEEPPADPLDGGYISIENDNERDATYRIREVRREGGRTLIDVGNVDFVRGMVDELDYSQGFLYDFEVGRQFRVVRTYEARW
ncbi:MAG: heparinase II/III family protein [Gemmatimonadota bacterium]|nr:heparinase II/III family protein [Gemmatimonadota bacterium]